MLEQLQNICLTIFLFGILTLGTVVLIFRNALIRRLNREHFPKTPQFADTELVITPPQPLPRTILLGSALFVPQGVNAVVARISPNARTLFEPGDYIITDIRASVFYYKFVDITLRNHTILVDNAPTKDGFKVSVWIKLSFRVIDPRIVVLLDEPVLELRMLVEDAVRSTTIQHDHNTLVPIPENKPIENLEIIKLIRNNLIQRLVTPDAGTASDIEIVRGIVLQSIIVSDLIGDPERKNYPKGDSEAQKKVKEAENRKKIAEIENQIRVQYANSVLEENKILQPVQERELALKQQREKPRLDLERERLYLQARVAAINSVLLVLVQIFKSSAWDRILYRQQMNCIYRMFEEICEPNYKGPEIINTLYQTDLPPPPQNSKEGLFYRLVDLLKIKDYLGTTTRELPNGNFVVKVFIKINDTLSKNATFFFNMSGNYPFITKIILQNSSGKLHEVTDADWYNNVSFSETIDRLNRRYHPDRKKSWFWH